MIAHNGIILNALYAKTAILRILSCKNGQPPGLPTVHRLQILTDNAGNDAHRDAALLVKLCHHKANIVLFAGRAAVIAGVGHGIHPVGKPHIDDAFMYIGHATGIFALYAAAFQCLAAGVLGDALTSAWTDSSSCEVLLTSVTQTRIWSPTAKRSWASPIQSHARSRA